MKAVCLGVVLLTMLILSAYQNALAQDDIPSNCENTTAEFYRPNIFARYDRNSQQLVLVDWTTGNLVATLDPNLPAETRIVNWSPNCRYLAVITGVSYTASEPNADGSIDDVGWSVCCAISARYYDTIESRLVGTSPSGLNVVWSPQSNQAIGIGRFSYFHLWTLSSNTVVRLRDIPLPDPNLSFYVGVLAYQVEWDYQRGWLWMSGDGGVIAYDLNGTPVAWFENYNDVLRTFRIGTASQFVFSPDRSKIIVFGQRSDLQHTAPAIAVYDIGSRQGVRVNPELNAAGVVALSPDNRYLVMGSTALRVWDLQNMPESFDARLPFLRLAATGDTITQVRFLDAGTLETVDINGVITRYSL